MRNPSASLDNTRWVTRPAFAITWSVFLHGLIIFCLAPGLARAADGTTAIATLVPYAEKAEVRDSIRQECGLSARLSRAVLSRSVKEKIPMLRLGNLSPPRATPEESDSEPADPVVSLSGSHTTLELRITDAIQTRGGLLPTHSLSIDGVLKEDGRIVGTFVGTRFARASFIPFRRGECAILSEAAALLAKDVVNWVEKPSLDARLGDAR